MNALSIKQAAIALGGIINGRNSILCPGPGHGRLDWSLSVTFNPDGSFVTHSFSTDPWQKCRDHVKSRLGLSDEHPIAAPLAPTVDYAALADRIGRGLSLWRQSRPIPSTLAETYLASRGLAYEGEALRFHPSCYFAKERHPAMLGLMTDAVTGEPCGVHRTALLPDGSGKATPGKMMLGRKVGAVIRLSADEDVTLGLGIAEGIETALATGFLPIWACMDSGNMAVLPVLSGIESLTIFADRDHAGMTAANECGRRWHAAGCEVEIAAPPSVGSDFADIRRAA